MQECKIKDFLFTFTIFFFQEKLHKEKCILINGSTNPTKDGDDTTARDHA